MADVADVQFWPRLEMSRPFVLSGLQTFLNVRQNRLEIQECVSRTARFLKMTEAADVRFWPRVELSRSFVLSELHRFLHVGLCRVEMQPRSAKLRACLLPGKLGSRAGSRVGLPFAEALDHNLF